MLAQYLPLRDLQAVLPAERLRDVAALVRQIDERPSYDPGSDRRFLAELFEAFHGPESLARKAERRRLLEYVPDDRMRELASALELSATGDFQTVAERVASIEWGANFQTESFLHYFGYPREYLPEPINAKLASEVVGPVVNPLKTLRDYQASVYYRTFAILRPPCARVMVQMPTGSGKTRTAMEIVAAFLNEKPERIVLWLAHSEELCEQAVESFVDVWRHVGNCEIRLQRCWGPYTPPFPSVGAAMIVGGFKKLYSLCKSGQQPPNVDLVVVDEAHMVLAPTYERVVAWAKRSGARVFGLSATPGRGSGGDAEIRDLAAYFNGRIVDIETDGNNVIENLQAQGVLARVVREPLYTNIAFELTRDEWRRLEEELEYPASVLRRMAENFERNRIVVEKLWALAKEGLQTIVFATSVEQSKLLCALLLYRGVSAAHIDGGTSPAKRRAVIAKFKRGEVRFLVNYQVLSTGFDAPGIGAVFIARPTKSLVLYSQMVGRGLRGPAVGGTTQVRLVDVIDNVVDYRGGLDAVYDYFSEYWR